MFYFRLCLRYESYFISSRKTFLILGFSNQARKPHELERYVLLEERDLGPSLGRHRRVLRDDENVHQVQARWTTLGRFVAVERSRIRARNGNLDWNDKSSGGASSTPDMYRTKTGAMLRASLFTKRLQQSTKNSKSQVNKILLQDFPLQFFYFYFYFLLFR